MRLVAVFGFLFLFLFVGSAHAFEIIVGVNETADARVLAFPEIVHSGLARVVVEVTNAGSVGIRARPQLAVELFRAWAHEHVIPPGAQETIPLYWYAPESRNGTAHVTVDLGALGTRELLVALEIRGGANASHAFTLARARVRSSTIGLRIQSEREARIAVIPLDIPAGWVVEQKETAIKRGSQTVVVGYKSVSQPQTVRFALVDLATGEASIGQAEIVEQTGWAAFFEDLRDWFEDALSR